MLWWVFSSGYIPPSLRLLRSGDPSCLIRFRSENVWGSVLSQDKDPDDSCYRRFPFVLGPYFWPVVPSFASFLKAPTGILVTSPSGLPHGKRAIYVVFLCVFGLLFHMNAGSHFFFGVSIEGFMFYYRHFVIMDFIWTSFSTFIRLLGFISYS